jgi:hypothetical protein
MKMKYATTINSVRQKNQQLIKQDGEKAASRWDCQIDASVFFDRADGRAGRAVKSLSYMLRWVSPTTSAQHILLLKENGAGRSRTRALQQS